MNPVGVGIDLVYVPRLKRIYLEYKDKFLSKVFTEEEIAYAHSKKEPFYSLASAFAAKEAFYKAVGGYSPFRLKEISLHRYRNQKHPELKLSGKALEVFKNLGGKKIYLSLSHDHNYAIAIVYLWGEK